MGSVQPLPTHGAAFFDVRDDARSMRASYHAETGVYVISLWRVDECLGSFRLPAADAPRLVHALVSPLVGDVPSASDGEADTA
jgi:hypothetical protein